MFKLDSSFAPDFKTYFLGMGSAMMGMYDEMTCDVTDADVAAANAVDPATSQKAIFGCVPMMTPGYVPTGTEPAFCGKLFTCLSTLPFGDDGCGSVVACTEDIESEDSPRCKSGPTPAEMLAAFEANFDDLHVDEASRRRARFVNDFLFAPTPVANDKFDLKTDGFSWRYIDNYGCDNDFVTYVIDKNVPCSNYEKMKTFAEANYKDAGHWFKAYGLGKHTRDDGKCDIAEWKVFQEQLSYAEFKAYATVAMTLSCETPPGSVKETWTMGSRAAYFSDAQAQVLAEFTCGDQTGLSAELQGNCFMMKIMLQAMFPGIDTTDESVVKAAFLEMNKLGSTISGATTAPCRVLPHTRHIFGEAANASWVAGLPTTTPTLPTPNTDILACSADCPGTMPTSCAEVQVFMDGCLADCNQAEKTLMLSFTGLPCPI
jgi:hypothetical protein